MEIFNLAGGVTFILVVSIKKMEEREVKNMDLYNVLLILQVILLSEDVINRLLPLIKCLRGH